MLQSIKSVTHVLRLFATYLSGCSGMDALGKIPKAAALAGCIAVLLPIGTVCSIPSPSGEMIGVRRQSMSHYA
ncbi:MAG: hypothetical protein ACREX4_05515 [Gammaproteobacteria bacterium]